MPILIHGAAEKNDALPLTGGTMSGNINMGRKDITNVFTLRTESFSLNGMVFFAGTDALLITPDVNDETRIKLGFIDTPTQDYHAANKAYVDSHLPQYVKLTTEGNDGKASYILPVGNQTLEVEERVLIPFRFLSGVQSSEGQYECTIETFLHEGQYKIYLCVGSSSGEPIGDASVNAKGADLIYFYDSPTPDKLLCLIVRRIE